jgi:hypothetical protein
MTLSSLESRNGSVGITSQGDDHVLARQVDSLLGDLMAQSRERLEQYRVHGSRNRVYRLPLSTEGQDFVIVKLLPSYWTDLWIHAKCYLKNIAYGEHDVSCGRNRVQLEKERIREWRAEGIQVPALIETTVPGARVFKGLHYPTFYSFLRDPARSLAEKFEALAVVTQSLSAQHVLAYQRQRKSLVHREPGPWNIMFDPDRRVAWWFDLEHPADYPRMTLDALVVGGVGIFLFGVLDILQGHLAAVVWTFVKNYEPKSVLEKFVRYLERSDRSLMLRLVEQVPRTRGLRKRRLRRGIAGAMRNALGRDLLGDLPPALDDSGLKAVRPQWPLRGGERPDLSSGPRPTQSP